MVPSITTDSAEKAIAEKKTVDSTARLNVSLPRSLYRSFRLHALDQDTTLSALVARLIRKELGQTEN
jgi:hypothetical protein